MSGRRARQHCAGEQNQLSATMVTGRAYTMSTSAIQHQGKSFPLGATLSRGGANFSVFAKHGRAAQLLLFDRVDDPEPSRVIDLDPRINRTYHYWHTFVPGVTAGQLYGYRVSGPFDPPRGLRFDPREVLPDPYGKGIARPPGPSPQAPRQTSDTPPPHTPLTASPPGHLYR